MALSLNMLDPYHLTVRTHQHASPPNRLQSALFFLTSQTGSPDSNFTQPQRGERTFANTGSLP